MGRYYQLEAEMDRFTAEGGKGMDFSRLGKALRLFQAIAGSRLGLRGPFFLSHLVTGRCICRCPTCLWRDHQALELDTGEIEDVYRKARKAGFAANVLWGGEPLLREDLPRLCRTSRREKMITLVITNGYYLPERCRELAPELDGLIVSLDYAEAARHDSYRGCEGLFARAVDGIQLVRSRYPSLKVMVNCLLHVGNVREVEKVASLAQELDVSLYLSPAMEGTAPDRKRSNRLALASREARKEAARRLLEMKNAGYPVNNSRRYLEKYLRQGESYRCRVPLVFLNVLPDGTAENCFTAGEPLGNVRQTALDEIVRSQSRSQRIRLGLACQKCIVPDVVETSYVWEFSPEPLYNTWRVFTSS